MIVKKHKILPKILLILFLVSSIGAAYLAWTEIQKEISIVELEKETIEEFVTQPPEDISDEPATEQPGNTESSTDYGFDWNGMKAINSEVIGWIRFDNPSRINYPIVQSTSNQYYLTHDWRGYYQAAGAIFLSKSNKNDFTDMNSVIYGHRMIGGSMFGALGHYESQSFMDANPYFYIYTPDGKKRTYEIYAYSEVIDGSDAYNIHFDTQQDRSEYFQMVKDHALTIRDVSLTNFDTTVTLSTCANYGYYERMILEGKLMKIEQY